MSIHRREGLRRSGRAITEKCERRHQRRRSNSDEVLFTKVWDAVRQPLPGLRQCGGPGGCFRQVCKRVPAIESLMTATSVSLWSLAKGQGSFSAQSGPAARQRGWVDPARPGCEPSWMSPRWDQPPRSRPGAHGEGNDADVEGTPEQGGDEEDRSGDHHERQPVAPLGDAVLVDPRMTVARPSSRSGTTVPGTQARRKAWRRRVMRTGSPSTSR